jgi:copper chaperone CopZ
VQTLKSQLTNLAGVVEAVVLPQERTIILKVDSKIYNMQDRDGSQLQTQVQTLVHQLLRG